ncbi:acetolactate synthase [bacterium]|nr:acetolactate synthase [bacterium]
MKSGGTNGSNSDNHSSGSGPPDDGSTGGGEATAVHTSRGRDYPSIRQFSIFAPNKVGQLLTLIRLVETARLRVLAMSIVDSAECSIIRLVVTKPENAYELLAHAGYRFCEVDLLVVELPNRDQPILAICSTLLKAEVNIQYGYPLMVRPYGRPALAFYVDDLEVAANILDAEGFIVLTEHDLES